MLQAATTPLHSCTSFACCQHSPAAAQHLPVSLSALTALTLHFILNAPLCQTLCVPVTCQLTCLCNTYCSCKRRYLLLYSKAVRPYSQVYRRSCWAYRLTLTEVPFQLSLAHPSPSASSLVVAWLPRRLVMNSLRPSQARTPRQAREWGEGWKELPANGSGSAGCNSASERNVERKGKYYHGPVRAGGRGRREEKGGGRYRAG